MVRLLAGSALAAVLALGLWIWAGAGRARPGLERAPRVEAREPARAPAALAPAREVVGPAATESDALAGAGRAVLGEARANSAQPERAAVEVRVRELDGSPAPDGTSVELSLVSEAEAIDPLLALERPTWTRELVAGRAVFPDVELGRTFGARATRPDSAASSRATGPGPRGRGQTAVIEVVLGSDHAILVYRAVDSTGAAFRNTPLTLEETRIWGGTEAKTVVSDDQGRFSLDLELGWIFAQGRLIVTYAPEAGAALRGRIEIQDPGSPGRHDQGDVVLEAAPPLAAGRVEDAFGNPIVAARVVAALSRFGDEPLERDGFRLGGPLLETTTDSAGRFELYGLLPDDELVLQAGSEGLRSEGVPVAAGGADVVLVLSSRCTVRGQLLLDPGVPPQSIQLRLLQDQDEEREEYGVESLADDGTFALEPVPPGLYVLECRLNDKPLGSTVRLTVAADVDVGALDLRGQLHVSEIVLYGAPDPDSLEGEVAWRRSGSEEAWRDVAIEGERVRLISAGSPVDVWVRPAGYRFVILVGVSGRREVVLEPPLRVRLELETDGLLPEFPHVFDPDLTQDGVHVGFAEGPEFFTRESRSVVFLVSSAGTLDVKWHLERRLDNGAVGGHVLRQHETSIEVLDVGGEQVFRLTLPGEALTELATNPPW